MRNPNLPRETVTYSSLTLFATCHKKYNYRYRQNLIPTETPVYFAFGSAIHKALELYLDPKNYRTEDAKNSALSVFEMYGLDVQDKCKAIALFEKYTETYKDDKFYSQHVEFEFCQPLKSAKGYSSKFYDLRGKVDAIINISGRWYIMEHKTTSACNDAYKARVSFDKQIALYALAVQDALNIEISGALYDVLEKPSIRLKKDETEEEFLKRCLSSISEENFYRQLVVFNPEYLTGVREEIWQQTQELTHCKKNDAWFGNQSSCINYGTPCEYMPLCKAFGKLEQCAELYKTERAHVELSNVES